MNSIAVAIFGAAGYGGQELLRLLANHPHARVAAVCSGSLAGRHVEEALPQLEGFFPDLRFTPPDGPLPDEVGAAFLALPHGSAQQRFSELCLRRPDLRVVDLSNDFRLRDPSRFRTIYGDTVEFPAQTGAFAYGLTETNREAIGAARWVANPGCFATGALLAVAPLAERGLLAGDLTLAQTTGSSGSGALAKETTHHPERVQDMRAYKVLVHQHRQEIEEELERLGAVGLEIAMVPQSGPFSRGIFTVAHMRLPEEADAEQVYVERYGDEFFVRLRTGTPALRHVARTNFCDLSVHQEGRRVVVLTAIDNLGKGMAGQAIQNLNLLFGLEETAGLAAPGANP
jgi:N-acetyl-gamma-glutamyl-phosphate reductase